MASKENCHLEKLLNICRICSEKIKLSHSYITPKKVTEYCEEVKAVLDFVL